MSSRRKELDELKKYVADVDNEITMILQNLQWDRNDLVQRSERSTCKFNKHHKVPSEKLQNHEEKCFLKCQGYAVNDIFLPEPLDLNMNTLIHLDSLKIQQIINDASQQDPHFKKGQGCTGPPPLTLERLQASYTADERRAIHDAVVSAVPACHDLSELALLSSGGGSSNSVKTRAEVLAELRDMKRRRAKYRGAARATDYTAELRGLIATQMELYSETLVQNYIKKEPREDICQNEGYSKNRMERQDDVTQKKTEREEKFQERNKCASASRKTQYDNSDRYSRNTRYERHDIRRREGSYKRKERDSATGPYHNRDDRVSRKRDYFKTRIKEEINANYTDYISDDKERCSRRRNKDDSYKGVNYETPHTYYNRSDRDSYDSRRPDKEYRHQYDIAKIYIKKERDSSAEPDVNFSKAYTDNDSSESRHRYWDTEERYYRRSHDKSEKKKDRDGKSTGVRDRK